MYWSRVSLWDQIKPLKPRPNISFRGVTELFHHLYLGVSPSPPRKKFGGLCRFLSNQVTTILSLPKHVEEAYQFHLCGNHFSEEAPKTSLKI